MTLNIQHKSQCFKLALINSFVSRDPIHIEEDFFDSLEMKTKNEATEKLLFCNEHSSSLSALHLNSDLSIKQKEFKLLQNIKGGLV
jgi:hypothetical protein